MAAFYAFPECPFHSFAGSIRQGIFSILRLLARVRSEVEKIVHWMPEILFAAEITFRGLDRCVPEQKLYLLKLTAAIMAELRTGSPQIVRRNVLQASFLAAGPNHVPNNILR